ncbi:hypothetical protein BJ138DRAFT_1117218 [Hygrophoropsis aurantiaca]|uniref:Uncharacterized protein n=1 Tax=Hygrophoropsis aurantiaca TaxID=72124 RepID=A0ACB7ZZY6_9AGAM|nr:hypothetical protein BJ138DRAFT_1117218 [Hygrophoropsis aurantiaca]
MYFALTDANIFIAASWGLIIFILAMQAILVIRVYALFNWSKKVLIFIATFYALQATGIFVMAAIFYNKQALRQHVISVSPTIGSVAQNFTLNAPSELVNLNQAAVYLAVAFDIILLFFALWAFVRHALEAKTLDGKWSINVLMRTLVADHLMYFIFNLTWLSLDLSSYFSSASELLNPLLAGMLSISSALAVIAGPHMMISLRETEKKMRGEGGTVAGEVSTVRFGTRESESGMEEGEGFRATDEHNE